MSKDFFDDFDIKGPTLKTKNDPEHIPIVEVERDELLWVEKYRPKELKDLVQEENLKQFLRNVVKERNMPHLLFFGMPGSGKTSAIHALCHELFKDHFKDHVMEFNASDDRGINAVREKISYQAKRFVSEIKTADGTIIPGFRVIILDEADSLTNEAQDSLRVIIEQYSGVVRFVIIVNYLTALTEAIKSRCAPLYFRRLDDEHVTSKLKSIAKSESMILNEDAYSTLIETSNGDLRKSIMTLQNLQYRYNYKLYLNKPLHQMNTQELKILHTIKEVKEDIGCTITSADIYEVTAWADMYTVKGMIKMIDEAKSIGNLPPIVTKIINYGYSTDHIVTQMNEYYLKVDKKLTDKQKATLFIYSSSILLKMKESCNEYIQLLDYVSCIYGIKAGLNAYKLTV